ncbi:NADH-ubiquinone oxidoreductase-F iron-sulfur binding region domain-containing protein [Halohasta litorea]|uniref:NADH-ubiquinone oxidoreductase-F iron-sulfur binding region domain-containing protein n=1 Tax=Halohasta litorea TaxID=869891 RepID=A0ABD6D6S3_9EURY|nr:NADH-ubiquinone oxidoreductase-F iron-sulfur binding region domain-containing protein [Halohasta litorea]
MTDIITNNEPIIRISESGLRRSDPQRGADTDGIVVNVGSTGVTAIEPLLTVTHAGATSFYTRCSPDAVAEIVERVDDTADGVAAPGDRTQPEPEAVVGHDPTTARLPIPPLAGFDTGVRTVLGGCGWRRPTNPADHEAAGGFEAPEPETVLEIGATLRGRGWGDLCHDAPLAETWETVLEADGNTAIVVNAHGADPDRLLLESAPFEVLDGAAALARTVEAHSLIVYASETDEHAVETVREAAANYPELPVPVDVVTGPAEYRAAEPTMALEAIEGNHRLEARLRPPGPEAVGLHGQPTLIHTPRTLAQLAVGLRDGGPPNTRLLTVTGDVDAPATVELPETDTLGDVLDAVNMDGTLKAARVGGRFGGLTSDLDVAVDPESLAAADLGTEGSVHLLADDRCIVEFVGKTARFSSEANCGRCVPCREGTTQLAGLLRQIYDGSYTPGKIEELVRVMSTSSICEFGVQAGRPVRTAMTEFEAEFEAHADGHCPAGRCLDPLEASV